MSNTSKNVTLQNFRHLRVEAIPHPNSMILKFVGEINEDSTLGDLLGHVTPYLTGLKGLMIDVASVQRINSCGIREWVLFLERLQSKIPCGFLQVGETFIEQAAVIPSILGKQGTAVLSFHAPFACASCKVRSIRVLTAKDIKLVDGQYVVPELKCEKCGGPLEFDGMEDEYFRFLRHSSSAAPT